MNTIVSTQEELAQHLGLDINDLFDVEHTVYDWYSLKGNSHTGLVSDVKHGELLAELTKDSHFGGATITGELLAELEESLFTAYLTDAQEYDPTQGHATAPFTVSEISMLAFADYGRATSEFDRLDWSVRPGEWGWNPTDVDSYVTAFEERNNVILDGNALAYIQSLAK